MKGMGPGTGLSPEEVRAFHRPSNYRGFQALATSWLMIAASFAAVAVFPGWISIAVALVILGGRHLAIAILMHDCSHYSLFKTRKLNDWIGSWLCAYPTWQDLKRYRTHHIQHHRLAGSPEDPDASLVVGYPTSAGSMARKFFRDLIGITALKRIYGLILMDFGFIQYTASADIRKIPQDGRSFANVLSTGIKNLYGVVITNTALFGILAILGHGSLYWLWVISYFTTFSVFVRIRSIAEHACTKKKLDQDLDPVKSTRTTQANWLARVTVAPHRVNYHLEHHLWMGIPSYLFPKLHRRLQEVGALQGTQQAQGYWEVLVQAMRS